MQCALYTHHRLLHVYKKNCLHRPLTICWENRCPCTLHEPIYNFGKTKRKINNIIELSSEQNANIIQFRGGSAAAIGSNWFPFLSRPGASITARGPSPVNGQTRLSSYYWLKNFPMCLPLFNYETVHPISARVGCGDTHKSAMLYINENLICFPSVFIFGVPHAFRIVCLSPHLPFTRIWCRRKPIRFKALFDSRGTAFCVCEWQSPFPSS